MSPSRSRRGAAFGAALLLLAGCGGEGGGGAGVAQLELVVCASDGEPPHEGLVVERVERAGKGGPIALRPVAGQPRRFEAPGADEGHYHLRLPDGWGHLFINSLPRLVPGGAPARFRVGRPHTFYLVSHQPRRLLGDTWGALRPNRDGTPGTVVPLSIEQDPSGITILRVPSQLWEGPLALMGRYVDGGLTENWVGELKAHGRPIYFELDPEPLAPLLIAVAGAPSGGSGSERTEVLEVELRVLGLPLPESQRRPVVAGVARFAGVSVGGAGVDVLVGTGPHAVAVRFPAGAWQATGELRLHAPPRSTTPGRVELAGATDGPGLTVQARAAGGDSYGLLPLRRHEAGSPYVLLDVGIWHLLIDDGTTLRERRIEVDGALKVATLDDPPPAPPAVVQGQVDVTPGLRVLWQRLEEGKPVLAHGFVLQTDSGGRYRGQLPPGTYEVVVEDQAGTRSAPRTVPLTSGMQLSLPLRR